jgi:hypothetical protein
MLAFTASMTVHTERRKKLRNRPPRLVYVELESGNGGMMRDLTEGGFALRAMMPLRAGEKTQFAFSLDEATRITGESRIVWIEEDGRVAGLEFSGLSATARRQILEYLAKPEEVERGPNGSKGPAQDAPSLEELRSAARNLVAPMALPKSQPLELPPLEELSNSGRSVTTPMALPKSQPLELPPLDELSDSGRTTAAPMAQTVDAAAPLPPEVVEPPLKAEPVVETNVCISKTPVEAPAKVVAEVPSEVPVKVQEIPAEARPVTPHPPPSAKSELGWQGQPTGLAPLPALEEEGVDIIASNNRWTEQFTLGRAVGIMLILTLLVGGAVFHRPVGQALIWLGQQIAGPEPTEVPDSSENSTAPGPAMERTAAEPSPKPLADAATAPLTRDEHKHNPAGPTSSESKPTDSSSAAGTAQPLSPENSALPTPSPTSQVNKTNVPPATSEPVSDVNAQEFQQAQQILHDPTRQAELPEAVRLLWVAVEKGNSSAEVVLANLYWKGQGVARNCDQTRILLSAATRKGNAEAKKQLEQLNREGCE